MKKWNMVGRYQSHDHNSTVTAMAISNNSKFLLAGTASGEVKLYDISNHGKIKESCTWNAAKEPADLISCFGVSPAVISIDFFPINRKCPFLMTATSREIHLWFISDFLEPSAPAGYVSDGLSFPPVERTTRKVFPNEVGMIPCSERGLFSDASSCLDGINFGYTENNSLIIRRIERLDPPLPVFTSESKLTRLDFHPKDFEIVLIGEECGQADIVDLRIQPHQTVPTKRASLIKHIGNRFPYITDCKFSPDGNRFFARTYNDLLIWDLRSTGVPVRKFQFSHENDEIGASSDGKEIFQSSWVEGSSIATGSILSQMYVIGNDFSANKMYITENQQKESFGLFSTKDKKIKLAKDHIVSSITTSLNGKDIAISCGSSIQLYNV